MIEENVIYNEDCVLTMERLYLAGQEVDLVVTSPPYDDIRSYEGTLDWDFEAVAEGLFDVLAEGGVVVWVVGDQIKDYSETGTSFRQALRFMEFGFKLHQTMIYSKDSGFKPDRTRYNRSMEYMFVLSKGRPKTINLIKDKPNKHAGAARNSSTLRQRDGTMKPGTPTVIHEKGTRSSIWEYQVGHMKTTTDKVAYEHPAIFPERLVRDHILSWSNKGDLVYDPFCGAGTTPKVARNLNRRFIGSEIVPKYCEIANKRLSKADVFDPDAERDYIYRVDIPESEQKHTKMEETI